jgi:hypothetical protein
MDRKTCIRCGGPLSDSCIRTATYVCIPCLRRQGDEYARTGDPRVFFGRGLREA